MGPVDNQNREVRHAFSLWLDLFRWVAALSVLVTHTGIQMLVRLTDLPFSKRTAADIFYAFLAGFDHYAVMVFFVISGFLVGGSLYQEMQNAGTVDVPNYLIKRLTRLCIVLWPALVLGLAFDLLSIHLFDSVTTGVTGPIVVDALNPYTLACNVAFLQTAACLQFGGNGALWSLYNEFWYYIVWPLLLIGAVGSSTPALRVAFLGMAGLMLVGLTVEQFTGSWFAVYMLIWLMGVVAAAAPKPLPCSVRASAIVFIGLLITIRILVRRTFNETHPFASCALDFAVSGAFANLLLSMRLAKQLPSPPGNTLNRRLASFSFSLYCVHLPILTLYISILMKTLGTGLNMVPRDFLSWVLVLGGLASSIGLALGFSLVTEAQTWRARQLVGIRPQLPGRF